MCACVCVSGGSLAKVICSGLPLLKTDWSKWHIFMCDERHVPHSDDECSYKYFLDNLLPKLPQTNFYPSNPNVICK